MQFNIAAVVIDSRDAIEREREGGASLGEKRAMIDRSSTGRTSSKSAGKAVYFPCIFFSSIHVLVVEDLPKSNDCKLLLLLLLLLLVVRLLGW